MTGAAGAVGRRLVELARDLRSEGVLDRVVTLDRRPVPPAGGLEVVTVDLATADLKDHLEGIDTLVHLASSWHGPGGGGAAGTNLEVLRRTLDAAGACGVRHVVLLSSATVYGAWPQNPVPLTEDAPVRPNPELAYAVHKAEQERILLEWRDGHPGVTSAVLRPAPAVGDTEATWLARALHAAVAAPGRRDLPPMQFVHLRDLASAAWVATRLTGPVNVAPPGWLAPEEVAELAPAGIGAAPGRYLRARRVRRHLGPLLRHPVVVAPDRLREAGWEPTHTNAEAFVAGFDAPWWVTLSPRRRQELILGAVGAGVVGAALGAGLAARRLLGRR